MRGESLPVCFVTNLKHEFLLLGILGAPKTCLHAVLSLLEKGVGTHSGPTCLRDTPRLSELAYKLIYLLAANRETSTPTLRYLRTTRDFLYRQLQHLPFTQQFYSMSFVSIKIYSIIIWVLVSSLFSFCSKSLWHFWKYSNGFISRFYVHYACICNGV